MSASDTDLANAIRALAMDAVEAGNAGHPGMPMGMADIATMPFTRYPKFDVARRLGKSAIPGARGCVSASPVRRVGTDRRSVR